MKKILCLLGITGMMTGTAQAALVYNTDFALLATSSGSGAHVLGGGSADVTAEQWFGSSNGVGLDGADLTLGNTTANRYRGLGVWLDTTGWATGLVTVEIDVADFAAGTDSKAIFQAYAANGVDGTDSVSLDLHGAASTGAVLANTGSATIAALGTEQEITADGTDVAFTFTYNGTDQYVGLVFANVNDPSTGTGNTANLDNLTVNTIPEPATLGMLVAFGGGLLCIRRLIQM